MGPDYHRPSVDTPSTWREMAGWKQAQPQAVASGDWWKIYHDPVLDGLERQVSLGNQTVQQAQAQYRQAAALLSATMAGFWPTITAGTSSTSSQTNSTMYTVRNSPTVTLDKLSVNANWTLDIWGELRREAEAGEATAAASQATAQAALLTAQATLAESYLQLRVLDADARMLRNTVEANQHTLDITRNLYASGVDTEYDVAQAQTQVKTVQAQLIDLGVLRAQLEHAIALLMGKPPAEFRLAESDAVPALPDIPAGVPSQLLEHRPDIAAAERQMAAANAQIGVAQAAFFPTLTLGGVFGYQSLGYSNLISTPNQYWSYGPALVGTLFDGGILSAQKAQAVAAYDASVANYRQTVLTGFQEVEDDLATLHVLAQENGVQQQAVESARRALAVSQHQYEAGTVNYINVLAAQIVALSAEKAQIDILGRQLVASAGLVTALGGLW